MSWLERYRRALEEAGGRPVMLDDDQVGTLLDLAREVAHGSERKNAPLATFLAGQYLAGQTSERGGSADAGALDEALRMARALLDEGPVREEPVVGFEPRAGVSSDEEASDWERRAKRRGRDGL